MEPGAQTGPGQQTGWLSLSAESHNVTKTPHTLYWPQTRNIKTQCLESPDLKSGKVGSVYVIGNLKFD